jgi:Zn-dependent metalloprotease
MLLRKGSRLTLFIGLNFLVSVLATAQSNNKSKIISIERNAADQTAKSIRFAANAAIDAGQTALLFEQYLGIAGKDNTMLPKPNTDAKGGLSFMRYTQYYKGILVQYGGATLAILNGKVNFITCNYYTFTGAASTVPGIGEAEAFEKAKSFVGAGIYKWELPEEEAFIKKLYGKADTSFKPKGQLVWIDDRLDDVDDRKMRLAYSFDIYAAKPLSRQQVFVDAASGKILFSNALIKHTSATGASKYSGAVPFQSAKRPSTYVLYDSTRGTGVRTLNLNNGTSYGSATEFSSPSNTWPASALLSPGIDVHWGSEMVYDYLWLQHGRKSWDNINGQLLSYIHYGTGYNNAFWNGSFMTYGDGTGSASGGFDPLTSLDITAHEIGHGICQATADLVYASEAGAMNEGFSDCWAATIEQYANPHETDVQPKKVWQIGEEVGGGSPLRYMDNPKLEGNPDTYDGKFWYPVAGCSPSDLNDYCGVHNNSGVLNKFYYLLTEGGSGTNDKGNAYTVAGVGWAKAPQILYQTELSLFSTATFMDCRMASIYVAKALYGDCSPEVKSVTNAWYAVNVGDAFVTCDPTIGFVETKKVVTELSTAAACPKSTLYNIRVGSIGTIFSGGSPVVTVVPAGGTAIPGKDYMLSAATMTFSASGPLELSAQLFVFDNGAVNDDRTIRLAFTLDPKGSDAIINPDNDTILIRLDNDDAVPQTGKNQEYHTLNTGASVISNITSPFPGSSSKARAQFLLEGSELLDAGVRPGVPITQIAFMVLTKNSVGPFTNFTVKMRNTSLSDMSVPHTAGMTTVYSGSHTTNPGLDSLDFNVSDFTWSGSSNVAVEICFDNTSAPGAANDQVEGIQSLSAYVTNWQKANSGTGCALSYTSSNANIARPVMRFRQLTPPSVVETMSPGNQTWDIRSGQEVYFYNTGNGKLISGLTDLSNDLGCVKTTISKAGVGMTASVFSTAKRSEKEITLTMAGGSPATAYKLSLYFTAAELAGIDTSKLLLLKTDAADDASITKANATIIKPSVSTATNYFEFSGSFTGISSSSRYFLVDDTICTPPVISITPASATLCAGESIALNVIGGAGYTYQWLRNNVVIGGATQSSYTALSSGTYSVKVYSASGCPATAAPVPVSVHKALSEFTLSGGGLYCAGGPGKGVRLSGSDTGIQYQLYREGTAVGIPAKGSGSALDFDQITNKGLYTVVAQNKNTGCKDTMPGSVTIDIIDLPRAIIIPKGTLNLASGSSTNLSATSGDDYTYQWLLDDVLINSATDTVYKAGSSGKYTLVVSNGLCTDTSDATILNFVDQMLLALVPNPNNGTFAIKGRLQHALDGTASVLISNMLGQSVYSSEVPVVKGIMDAQFTLTHYLAKAMYLVKVTAGEEKFVFHLMVK